MLPARHWQVEALLVGKPAPKPDTSEHAGMDYAHQRFPGSFSKGAFVTGERVGDTAIDRIRF